MDSYLLLPDKPEPGSITSVIRTALTAFSEGSLPDAWQRGHDVTVASLIIQHQGTLMDRFRQALRDGINDALTLAPEAVRADLEAASRKHVATAMAQLQASTPSRAQRAVKTIAETMVGK